MTRELSLYLDAWRFSVALVVLVGHLSGGRFTGGLLWQFGPYMSQAVAIFFVLSGFVIAYVVDQREGTARDYVVARLARIYSVAIPALFLTFGMDAIGREARPDLYTAAWGYVWEGRAWQFFSSLVFINQLWSWDTVPGSGLPYWSLGYEVWYYALFGIAVFAPKRWRFPILLAVGLLVGPRILAMLPLWLLGLVGYHFCSRNPLGPRLGATLFFGSVLAWVSYEILVRIFGRMPDFPAWPLERTLLSEDYLVAVLFTLHIIGFRAVSGHAAPLLQPMARTIRWVAGATFTIYLLHIPVAQFLITQVPWPPSSWATRFVVLGGTLAALFAIAEFTERRKMAWRRAIEMVLRPAPLTSPHAPGKEKV